MSGKRQLPQDWACLVTLIGCRLVTGGRLVIGSRLVTGGCLVTGRLVAGRLVVAW